MPTKMVNGVVIELTAQEISDRAAEEAAWAAGAFDRAIEGLRRERDIKLAETDYLALADQPAMSQAMTGYRQDLRDITDGLATEADVNNVTWPTKP
jgi:hypothetical protein